MADRSDGGHGTAPVTTSHAEVGEVWPRDGGITVRGEIVHPDVPADARWRLRLVSRDRGTPPVAARVLRRARAVVGMAARPAGERELPVKVDGVRFEVVIPLGLLVTADAPAQEIWDLHLTAPGGRDLRLGRHLDDMPGKKDIVVFPRQAVNEPAPVSIRPYYTAGNHLSIRCRRRDEEQ